MGPEMMVVTMVVINLSLLGGNTVIYVENSMEFVKILVQLRSLTRLWDIRSTYKNQLYFMYLQPTIKVKIMSLDSMKSMKYLGMNLTEDVQDLHTRTVKHGLKK